MQSKNVIYKFRVQISCVQKNGNGVSSLSNFLWKVRGGGSFTKLPPVCAPEFFECTEVRF